MTWLSTGELKIYLLVVASITLSWPSFKKAGLSAARGIETTTVVLPSKSEIKNWQLFYPHVKKKASMMTIDGVAKGTSLNRKPGETLEATGDQSADLAKQVRGSGGGKASAPASSLKGITLLGTISIAGLDGIIVPSGGKEKIILVGETMRDWQLVSVTPDSARFKRDSRVVEIKLVRKTLITETPSDLNDDSKDRDQSVASGLAKIPDPKQLGLHAIMSSSSKVKGGKDLKKKGFRRGMLVRKVDADSLAFDARLVAGDFIYKIDGKSVRTPTQMRVAASKVSRNESVDFVLLRDGITREVSCAN